jgi:hypothetical protein
LVLHIQDGELIPMRMAVLVIAVLVPGLACAQGESWSLELLEQYAAWVREGGFSCPTVTRVVEAGSEGERKSFKVVCSVVGTPDMTREIAFRLTLRPNGMAVVTSWQD